MLCKKLWREVAGVREFLIYLLIYSNKLAQTVLVYTRGKTVKNTCE